MITHRVTLYLPETPTDILERELQRALESARKCEAQGSPWHTWGSRAEAIRSALEARRRDEAASVPLALGECASQPIDREESPMQAFVNVPRARGHYQYNTQPMDRDAAIEYAYSVSKQGRNAIVLRAAPVTPGLTPRQSLERHESFLTSDVIAEFRAQGD